jgi:hypothetical protein
MCWIVSWEGWALGYSVLFIMHQGPRLVDNHNDQGNPPTPRRAGPGHALAGAQLAAAAHAPCKKRSQLLSCCDCPSRRPQARVLAACTPEAGTA